MRRTGLTIRLDLNDRWARWWRSGIWWWSLGIWVGVETWGCLVWSLRLLFGFHGCSRFIVRVLCRGSWRRMLRRCEVRGLLRIFNLRVLKLICVVALSLGTFRGNCFLQGEVIITICCLNVKTLTSTLSSLNNLTSFLPYSYQTRDNSSNSSFHPSATDQAHL